MKSLNVPDTVKIAAVVTAMPRWVVAMLASEGLVFPENWQNAWTVISAILAAAMAISEGVAFAFLFSSWKKSSGKPAKIMIVLAILSALVFVGVLAPSMAASVRQVSLDEYLHSNFLLMLWTSCVALSTMLIVVSVGYAQKEEKLADVNPELVKLRTELRETKRELTQTNSELTETKDKLGDLSGLVSKTKKEQILAIYKLWGDKITQKVICDMVGATSSQVSQVLGENKNG